MSLFNTSRTANYSLKPISLKTPASVPKLTADVWLVFNAFIQNVIRSFFSCVNKGGKLFFVSISILHFFVNFFHFRFKFFKIIFDFIYNFFTFHIWSVTYFKLNFTFFRNNVNCYSPINFSNIYSRVTKTKYLLF